MRTKTMKTCMSLRSDLRKHLKTKFPAYMSQVVEWLKKKKTRVELDLEVCELRQEGVQTLHSEFLMNLSKLCWGLRSLRVEIPTLRPFCGLSEESPAEVRSPKKKIFKDPTLPGLELIKARLFVAAWEAQLTIVDHRVSRLLYCALQHYVKDVIQTALDHKTLTSSDQVPHHTIDGLTLWRALSLTNLDQPANLRSCR